LEVALSGQIRINYNQEKSAPIFEVFLVVDGEVYFGVDFVEDECFVVFGVDADFVVFL